MLITNIGSIYPIEKSFDVIGVAYILTRNELEELLTHGSVPDTRNPLKIAV